MVVDDYNAPLKVVSWEGKESENFIFLKIHYAYLFYSKYV